MKLKYVGKISPVNLYPIQKSVSTGEVFECEAQYAAELMGRFNEKGKPAKFVEAKANEKVGAPGKEKKPNAATKDVKETQAKDVEINI